jgi:hypothetical protein
LWHADIESGSVIEVKSHKQTPSPILPINPTLTPEFKVNYFLGILPDGRRWYREIEQSRFHAISRDGRLGATAKKDALWIWDIATGMSIARLVHDYEQVPTLASSFDKSLLTISPDGRLGTWDLSRIPDGNYFQIVCGFLPGHSFYSLNNEYNITIEPVCGEGYDPPLP